MVASGRLSQLMQPTRLHFYFYCTDLYTLVAFVSPRGDPGTAPARCRSKTRAAGIMQWPTDGHPESIAAVMAHPGELAGVAVSSDGRQLITASCDGHVAQWLIDGAALERRAAAAGTGAERWRHALHDGPSLEEVQRCGPWPHASAATAPARPPTAESAVHTVCPG